MLISFISIMCLLLFVFLITNIIVFTVPVMLIIFLYNIFKRKTQSNLATFFNIGLLFFLITTLLFHVKGRWSVIGGLAVTVLVFEVGHQLYNRFIKNNMAKPLQKKSDLDDFYREQGLANADIAVFRETMAEASQAIHSIEDNFALDTHLKAIDMHHSIIPTLKNYFKTLVRNPIDLPKANKFLYTYLPTLDSLTVKYVNSKTHLQSSSTGQQTLNEARQTIDTLCLKIIEDYSKFLGYNNLDETISITKNIIND